MENICKNATVSDCLKCDKYYTSHSWHYDSYYGREVLTIKCCIGGCKTFSEDGDNIEK